MAEYKINIRFPIKVQKKSPFVYSGPDFRSLTLGAVSDTVSHRGLLFQRLYPFTVSRMEHGHPTDLLFCFTFLIIDDDGKLGLFLTSPCPLADDDLTDAFEALLNEAEKSARFFRGLFLEIEVNDEVLGSVAYPSSLSFLSYDLDKSDLHISSSNVLTERGFQVKRECCSYQNDVDGFLKITEKLVDPPGDFSATFLTRRELDEVRKKRSKFKARSCELSNLDEGLREFELPFFEDTALNVKWRGGGSLFRKEAEGYLRWLPDVFQASSTGMTPHLNIFPNLLEETRYSRGKIFDWGISNLDRRLLIGLLARGAASMSSKGIKTFEFARVGNEQKFIVEILEETGFGRVHAGRVLRKELR